jgi:polar amino acid transport system substrate-binding protein
MLNGLMTDHRIRNCRQIRGGGLDMVRAAAAAFGIRHLMMACVMAASLLLPASAKAGQPVHLACNDFPPLKIEHPGSNGLPGSDVDLLHELFHRADVPLEISYLPWKRAFAAAQEGQVDGLCSCSYAADRDADFFFSDEIGRVSIGIFTLSPGAGMAQQPVASLAELKAAALSGKSIGVVGGYALEGDIDQLGIPRDLASDDTRALDMLMRKRYDYLYSYEAPIKFLVKYPSAGQAAQPQLAYRELRGSPYFLCLGRKVAGNAGLLKRLNAVLADMRKDGTIDRILDHYR